MMISKFTAFYCLVILNTDTYAKSELTLLIQCA